LHEAVPNTAARAGGQLVLLSDLAATEDIFDRQIFVQKGIPKAMVDLLLRCDTALFQD
jgi:hypothetical protein